MAGYLFLEIAGNEANQLNRGVKEMAKVKSFATELKIFHTMNELENLDAQVNQFIKDNEISKIVSVSDTCTTDDKGGTIGLIRVVTYE